MSSPSSSNRPKGHHGSRSKGRELALKFLYAADLSSQSSEDDFDRFVLQQQARGRVVDFARRLVRGVITHSKDLDQRITECAANWSLHRMAAVDRNLLRLAAFELLHEDTPPLAVINEAVELAKKFGAQKSPSFVNGILDRLHRQKES